MRRFGVWIACGMLGLVLAAPGRAAGTAMTLAVDATEAPRGLLHARLTVPVAAGRVTLVYPKWLPGEHGPTGPITDLVGFAFAGGGHALAWARDTVDMYAFHITVPAGVTEIAASYDFLLPAGGRFSSGVSSTPNLVLVSWNQVVLYPAGERSDDVRVTASLKIPAIWDFGTPLEIGHGSPSAGVVFKTVSLTTLVDSPVLAGRYFRSVRLNPGEGPPVYLDMAADSREALEIKPDQQAALSRLVGEAHTLFGVRHYRDYHFLCTLSDHTAHFGLEHHESSDDRMSERWLIDKDVWIQHSNLLPHEYTHSWNGKFRRPAGLATPDYQQPMRDELLWVYEGLTQYLGTVLGARSGVRDAATSRDAVAYAAANLDMHRGREWRPLLDTAVAAQLLYQASDAWQAMRRGTDFYNESIFIWLEADAIIRKASGGQRSLDDFCKTFHGGEDGRPMLKPYTFDDVVATLNAVQPHDWRAFLDARVSSIQPHPPLGGLEACGWKLGWADSLSAFEKVLEDQGKHTDMQYSIGLLLGEDGMIEDVIPGSSAARAGLGPGMKVVAANGRAYTAKMLRAAVKAAKGAGPAVELIVVHDDFFRTVRLDEHGGLRYPMLVRIPGTPDLLSSVFAPHAGGGH